MAEVDFIVVRESDNGIESERDVDVVSCVVRESDSGIESDSDVEAVLCVVS